MSQAAWFLRLFGAPSMRVAKRVAFHEPDFWSAFSSAVLQSSTASSRSILVYVHGFNVSFDQAALRAAQLGADLKVAHTAFFSWPSAARFLKYPTDEATIEASIPAICRFLLTLIKVSDAQDVHLVAHSMGNRGLLHALHKVLPQLRRIMPQMRLGQIILAAPDVDVDVFREHTENIAEFCSRATLYASEKDKAVGLSRWLHTYDRAGFIPPTTVVDRVDTVVVTQIDLSMIGHGYYAEAAPVLDNVRIVSHIFTG
jgi:esterase/lipase superfamily enzyme